MDFNGRAFDWIVSQGQQFVVSKQRCQSSFGLTVVTYTAALNATGAADQYERLRLPEQMRSQSSPGSPDFSTKRSPTKTAKSSPIRVAQCSKTRQQELDPLTRPKCPPPTIVAALCTLPATFWTEQKKIYILRSDNVVLHVTQCADN